MADAAPIVQPQAYDADGKPIAPEQYAAAAKAGQAYFPEGSRVFVRNQAGKLQSVPAEQAGHEGLTVLHPEEVQAISDKRQYGTGLGNTARAAAEGFGSGLTLGGTDALIAGVGGEEARKGLAGRRRANPIASGVGQVAGALAPLALSGGAAAPEEAAALGAGEAAAGGASALGTAGELAGGAVRTLGAGHRAIAGVGSLVERGAARGLEALGATGETALGRIGAAGVKMAARGAAEGALYGGAQAASDSVLSGDDITAEKIVAGMGHGALFGGALGGALGLGGSALSEGAAKLVPKREALEQVAREQGLKGAGFKGSDFRKLAGRATGDAAETRIAATADDLMRTTLETGEQAGQRVLQPGANVEETLGRVSQAKTEAAAKLGGLKDTISEGMDAAGERPDLGKFFQRVKDEVTGPLYASKIQGSRSSARAVERQLSTLVDEHATRMAAAAGDADALARIASGEVSAQGPSFRELDAIRSDLRNVFQPKAPGGGGMPPPPPKAAQYLEKTERILSDYLKDEAGQFLAKAGENPNAYNEANRLYSSFAKLEQVGTKTANQSLGNRSISPSDHALGAASFLGAMTTGNVGALGAMGYGAAATFANKLLRERGNSFIADMARRASESDNVIESASKALAGVGEKVKAPALAAVFKGESLSESYERTAARVRELAQPAIAQQHLSATTQEMAAHYPDVGAAVSRKLLTIYQQLSANLPPSHVDTGSTLTPLAIKQRVSPFAQQQFMSSVKGALQPTAVIADLGRGVIDREAIESLKQAHPLMFQQLRQSVATAIQTRPEEVSYRQRVMLSMVFDFVGDSSMEPQALGQIQQVAQSLSTADAMKDAQMMQPTGPKKGSGGKDKTATSFELPSQAAISGGT
jgi:hypothetical protein